MNPKSRFRIRYGCSTLARIDAFLYLVPIAAALLFVRAGRTGLAVVLGLAVSATLAIVDGYVGSPVYVESVEGPLLQTALALLLSGAFVKETRGHALLDASRHTPRADGMHDHLHAGLTDRQIIAQTSLREPALSSASQAAWRPRSEETRTGPSMSSGRTVFAAASKEATVRSSESTGPPNTFVRHWSWAASRAAGSVSA